jgi:hypothetical protein
MTDNVMTPRGNQSLGMFVDLYSSDVYDEMPPAHLPLKTCKPIIKKVYRVVSPYIVSDYF